MWILSSIGKDKLPLREAFGLDFPQPTPGNANVSKRFVSRPFIVSFIIIGLAAMSSIALPDRQEVIPDRKLFSMFPLAFDGWEGRTGYLEQIYIDALKVDDYLINDYVDDDGKTINLYAAYYESQRKGASVHSPRSCIPGGGWRITSLEEYRVPGVAVNGDPLKVNRLIISKGEVKQLVYYWFQQRGRIITSEYLMKWYLFWDALNRSRTDGALIRLTTVLNSDDSIARADERLTEFVTRISPLVTEYVPE